MSTQPRTEAAGQARLPKWTLIAILSICAAPLLLTLLGVDFGTRGPPVDPTWAATAERHEVVDATFRSLSGALTHTIMEWSALCMAMFVVVLALSHYRITRDVTTPILGVAFFMSACMDAFHTLAADRLISAAADNRDLIPFTWAICRLFNAGIMITGVSLVLVRPQPNEAKRSGLGFVVGVSLAFGVVAYAIIHVCAVAEELPQTTFPGAFLTRPYDALPLALFAFAGLVVYPRLYKRRPSMFTHALVVSAIPETVTQLHMTFGSTALFDSHFNIAHFMKIGAYTVPLVGLLLDYVRTHESLRVEMDERRDVEEALRASEVAQRTVLETMLDAQSVIDERGIIQSANPAMERLLGYERAELIGQNVSLLMPDLHASAHDGYLARYAQTGEARVIGSRLQLEALHKDGTLIPIELSVAEMQIGERRLYSGQLRDIRERKRIDRLKNEFVSTVSHELRTPLTSIRGALSLLTGGALGEFDEKASEFLRIAHSNSERLLLLINDILDIEKIASGDAVFRFAEIELASLAAQATRDLSSYAQEREVTFELFDRSEEARVYVDADRILQVLANLMSNAAKFSPRGGTVEILVSRQGKRVRVSVTDRGPGIPEEFQPRLFERFTQSDSSDRRELGGTGLGLAIVKEIVERHGGQVGFVTRAGLGTTFYFDLRAATSSAALLVRRGLLPTPSRAARVLIVEEDREAAALLHMIICRGGCDADIASDVAGARRLLEEVSYGALIFDLSSPGEGGLSFLASLRTHPATQNLPVIVVSGLSQAEATGELTGGALQICDWLEKPIGQERLLAAIHRAAPPFRMPTVLHVEDDPSLRSVVSALLEGQAHFTAAATVAEAKALLTEARFDLVLLDVELPDGSGLELLELLQSVEPPTSVVIFSAAEVGLDVGGRVAAALVKGTITERALADRVCELLGNPPRGGSRAK
ncbi:MAG: response regulator [Planctomycetes bacterium]|nr:response regulator [Planctomycetota bacterium]